MGNIRIREALSENGVTIEELRKRMNVNRQTIYYYIEQDDKNPVTQLQKIADAIGCDLMDLFIPKNSQQLICPYCKNQIKIKIEK